MPLNKLPPLQSGHEVSHIDVYHNLKTTLDQYYRSITFVSISSKEGRQLKQRWREHHNTFGRIRWIIKHKTVDNNPDDNRYHLIVEDQSPTDPAQFFSCWMIDLP